METDIYVGDSTEPAVQTVSLFVDGVAYDFLSTADQHEEITILDPVRGRLILLDPGRQIKTTLSTDSILGFVAQMKAHLQEKERDQLAEPVFERKLDEEGWLTLSSDVLTYRVKGQEARVPTAVARYQEFADWYARLNAMRPGNVPPFARFRVNAELAEENWLPAEVERTVLIKRGLSETRQTIRSKHLVTWSLSQSDFKRMDRAGTGMASYEAVRFTHFLGLEQLANDQAQDDSN